jgi:hypothetical protein
MKPKTKNCAANSRALFIGSLLLALSLPLAAQQPDLSWMLSYRDKGENALASDPRFPKLLEQRLPTAPLPAWSNVAVNKAAIDFLGGVPGYVNVRQQRDVVATGCPAHACVARALLWVDVKTGALVFVCTDNEQDNDDESTRDQYHIARADLYLATLDPVTAADLPDSLRGSIIRWLHQVGVLRLGSISLISRSGTSRVSPEQLCWTGRCSYTNWD